MSVLSLPVVFSQSTSPCMELCSTFLSARFLGKTRKHWQVSAAIPRHCGPSRPLRRQGSLPGVPSRAHLR